MLVVVVSVPAAGLRMLDERHLSGGLEPADARPQPQIAQGDEVRNESLYDEIDRGHASLPPGHCDLRRDTRPVASERCDL